MQDLRKIRPDADEISTRDFRRYQLDVVDGVVRGVKPSLRKNTAH